MRLPGASHQRSTGRHRHLALRNCSTHRTAGESRATHRVQPPIEASWADRRLPASGSTSRRGGRCLLRPSLRNTGILPRFRPPDGCHIVRGPGRCKTPTSPTQGPTLFVWGPGDLFFPLKWARRLADPDPRHHHDRQTRWRTNALPRPPRRRIRPTTATTLGAERLVTG